MPDINLGRLRGGFCVYWTGPDGKRTRRQLAACTRKEAEAEAIEVYRRATYADRTRGASVADIWRAYLNDLGDKPTATTMGYTGKAILPFFGPYRPEDLTKAICRDYAARRYQDGKSQGTVWTEIGHLQTALNHAYNIRTIDRAPKLWRPEKPERDMRILDRGEANALIDGTRDPHIRLAIVLLLGTAARVGAILDLTWDRIDLERGVINLRLPDAATRKGRAIVPMNGATRAALDVARQAALSDYVIEYAGGPVKSIRTGVTAAIRRSGIGHVRIHDLRHTAAVTMLSAGIPIEKVAQVMGHSNVAVTYRVYGRFLPEHMQDAVNVLDFGSVRRGA